MSIFANEGKNVLVSYNYMLRVEGIYDLPCKSVHSFTKENEFEYVQEGGLNDYVHMLRKPISKPFSFTVERYVGTDPYPPLPMGDELILPVILMVSSSPNQFEKAKRTFVFTGCTVMSKTYGELNAERSGILTETIVIGYREMMEVTVPVHFGEDGSLWSFDGKKVLGNNKTSAVRNKQTASKKRSWMVGTKEEDGQEATMLRVQSAKRRGDLPERQNDVINPIKKRLWKFNGKDYLGNDDKSRKTFEFEGEAQKQRYWLETTSPIVQNEDSEKKQDAKELADGKEIAVSVKREKMQSAKTRYMMTGLKDTASGGKQRYWLEATLPIMQNEDSEKKQDAKELAGTKEVSVAVSRERMQSAKTRYTMTGIKDSTDGAKHRYWIENTLFPEGYKEGQSNGVRVQQQSAKTRYKVTSLDDPAAKAQRYWIKNTLFPEGYKEQTANGNRVQQQSAKNRYQITGLDDSAAKAQRYWIKNTLFPEGYKEQATNGNRVQKQSAKNRYQATGLNDAERLGQRYWIKNTLFPAGYKESTENSNRVQIKSAKDRYALTGINVLSSPADQRYWLERKLFPEGYTKGADGTRNRVQKASAKDRMSVVSKNEQTEQNVRLWKFNQKQAEGSGNISHKSVANTVPEQRRWTDGQASARKQENAVAQPGEKRRWAFRAKNVEGNSNRSGKTAPDSKAKVRKWELKKGDFQGSGTASANHGPESKARRRKWTMVKGKGRGEKSANHGPNSTAKKRKWEMTSSKEGKGNKSANKGPNSKAEQRAWPKASSARQYEDGGRGIAPRRWPEVSSARKYEG